MKPDLFKIHIFITIIYVGVALAIGLAVEAIALANNKIGGEVRWVAYPFIIAILVLGIGLLRAKSIDVMPTIKTFFIFAILALGLVFSWMWLTQSIEYLMLLYSFYTLFLMGRGINLMVAKTTHPHSLKRDQSE